MEKGSSKKDVLQLEKRVVDLELGLNELKEKLESPDLGAISEFKQRLEDVEDLAMVENAGIVELKKMLEGIDAKTTQPEITLPANLEERLNGLEEKVKTIPEVPSLGPLEEKITSLETTRNDFSIKMGDVERKITDVGSRLSALPDFEKLNLEIKNTALILENLRQEIHIPNLQLEKEVNGVKAGLETFKSELGLKFSDFDVKLLEAEKKLSTIPDFERMKNEIKTSVFSSLPSFAKFEVNLMKMSDAIKSKGERIEKLAGELEEKIGVSVRERVEREIEHVRDDWLAYSEKVNSVEKFVKDFSKEIDEIKPTLKKVDSFEHMLDLDKKTGEKLQEFSAISKNLQETVGKNTLIYNEIEKRTQKLDTVEKELPSIQKNISTMLNEIQRLKLEAVEKKDVASLISNFHLIADDYKSLVEDMSRRTAALQANLNKSLKEMESRTKETIKPLDSKIGTLESNITTIVSKSDSLQKRVDETWKSIPSAVGSQIQVVNKRVESLEAMMKGLKTEDVYEVLENIDLRIGGIENRISGMKGAGGKIGEIRVPPIFFDEQVKDLINRMIFLESRLVAIESSMQRTSMALPVIME